MKVYSGYKFFVLFMVVQAMLMLSGCTSLKPGSEPPPLITSEKVLTDLKTLESLEPQLAGIRADMQAFHEGGGWQARGYFNAEETRDLEYQLYRFTTSHTALWDLVDSYGGPDAEFDETLLGKEAHLVSASAVLMLANHSASMILEFADDEVAIKQINQAYFRSDIGYGTYDKLRSAVTERAKKQVLEHIQASYLENSEDPAAALNTYIEFDEQFAGLAYEFPGLLQQALDSFDAVHEKYSSYVAARISQMSSAFSQHKGLYKVRSVVFKDVSRLKSPTAKLIKFSNAQKAQVYDLLEPGDLILTYTAGYMSSVFIPGAFKHGITFIGTPEQRQTMSLTMDDLSGEEIFDQDKLANDLERMQLESGKNADVIESVAEGVIFNNLEHIMDTHINRLLVLRPQLSESERRAFLAGLFTYLGNGYDFRFDFSDSTYQVCTEVIWREIDGKGNISFVLTKRAGNPTLSADDIVNYYLESELPAFEFVLYAEEAADSEDHNAIVRVGDEGKKRLQSLMDSINQQGS